MLFKTWLNTWLDSYVAPAAKHRTIERYRLTVDLHILPYLGDYDMDDITPLTLQKHVTELTRNGNRKTNAGLSVNTVNMVISVLRSAMYTAFTLGVTKSFPAEKIKRPRPSERKIECFSMKEQAKIEKAVLASDKPKLLGVVVCLYTGLRIGELLALRKNDYDPATKTFSIAHSCHDGKTGRITDTPKTPASSRVIPVPKQLLPIVSLLKKGDSDYLITENGNPVSVRSYQRSFELLLRKLKIPHRGFHALRHTFATRALECGMDVKTLSEILGHQNPSITLKRYTHSLMEHKKEMMNRLGKSLKMFTE